ncbi:hypothetical protein [Kineococcus sp. R86509]|uniref:hypothetical protein n=1 Tax=Kineococcus sp. R86509 TaxID=3093851 RepID=UPI0036D26CA0
MLNPAGPTPGARFTRHALNAATLTAVALLSTACASQDAGALRNDTTPASPSSATTAAAQASASARAEVAGQCPAVTDVPAPISVDEGQRLSEGLTLEQDTQRAQDEQQASVLDAWLRCAYPDAYAQLRIAYEPQFHVVAALTKAAGPDPLASAPAGVLAGRVEVETTPFSELQMRVLYGRVDAALQSCDLGATSAVIEVGVIRLGAGEASRGEPGVEAVQECLDAVELGTEPGRAQVEVTNETDIPT